MILVGWVAFPSSNRSSSISVACFENTLKLTPPGRTVAPRGALAPDVTTRLLMTASCSLARPDRPNVPDVAAILSDRAVGRETADSSAVENRHARPVVLIGVRLAHALLALNVGLIVRQEHVVVAGEQRFDERVKQPAIAIREELGTNEIDRVAQFRI